MRILVRTSNWAIWARRLGSFALPLAVLPVLMHRTAAISTDTFEIVEVAAVAVALAALATALIAFVRIWVTGDEGWGRAVAGLVLALVCLVPPGLLIADYLEYPMVDEVSTDPLHPPSLVSRLLPPPLPGGAAVAARFPNLKTRRYPLAASQLFDIVERLAADRGWDILRRRAPEGEEAEGQLNAIATTLFGFRDEVSIRIVGGPETSTVDMRSVSLTALHEPGSNAGRVESFLGELDARISEAMNDAPAGATQNDGDTDAAPDSEAPVIPAPAPRARKR